jgi:hypothetical protein
MTPRPLRSYAAALLFLTALFAVACAIHCRGREMAQAEVRR